MADVQIFREHLEKHNLVGFGGYKIKTYCDEEGNLKKALGTGKWKHINRRICWEIVHSTLLSLLATT